MADAKISALTAASSALLADELPVNEAGVTKKVTLTQVAALMGNTLTNVATADQTINAATTAYITNSNIAVPVGKLRVGTVFQWVLSVSKTAAGTAANTFIIKMGTAGTTADTSVITFTLPVGTAVVDVGTITIVATVRGPLSASGIVQANFCLTHNLQITGLATIPCLSINVTSAAFDVTTAGLIVGLACTTAASTVLTFQQCVATAINL